MEEIRNAFEFLVRKLNDKRPLRRRRHLWRLLGQLKLILEINGIGILV
jgi:hypothetical protein